MRLIIFGPPGCGKGTYSARLKEIAGVRKISTGDIIRAEIRSGSELGREFESRVKKGLLVPDEIVNEILRKELERNGDNFILDGYPRTIDQAKFLLGLTKIDALINIKLHDEVLMEKICARRICSNTACDGNYNIADIHRTIGEIEYILPPILPKVEGVCDKCGSRLIQRPDDTPDIIKERLEVYYEQSKPVLDFLRGKVPFAEVWMNRPVEQVVGNIVKGLKDLKLL